MQKNEGSELPKRQAIKIQSSLDECLDVPPSQSLSPSLFDIEFTGSQDAENFYHRVLNFLPITGLEYPQLNESKVVLTNEQFYCFQISLMHEVGELKWEFLADQYLMKTLRADEYDFTASFKLGLIPGEYGRRYNNLRPVERGDFVITSEGDIVPRAEKKPQYTPEQKKEFSQIQSNTFLDEELLAEAFGFSKERNAKLYGLLTHLNDALINRLLIRDAGTVGRPFDFSDVKSAEQSQMNQKEHSSACLYPVSKFEEFKQHNLVVRSEKRGTNEILARLRFNPYRSLIVICSDTLETRLLADYFAQELMQEFRVHAQRMGLTINPEFKIPVLYYLPIKSYLPGKLFSFRPGFRFYSENKREADQKECRWLYDNTRSRNKKFNSRNYEFLLGLPKITSKMALDKKTPSGKPLVLEMIYNGRARMMSRFLRSASNPHDNSLIDNVFGELLSRNKIKKDDPILASLLLVEEGDLFRKLVDETGTDLKKLSTACDCSFRCDFGSLDKHLRDKANPRQIKLLGLKDVEDDSAVYRWTVKKLFLKEFPRESKRILGELLYQACLVKAGSAEIKFLFESGADKSFRKGNRTPIMVAADLQDWAVVRQFSQYNTDVEDKAHYGYALFIALKSQKRTLAESLLKAGARGCWRRVVSGYELVSTIHYAVVHGYVDLVPELIQHEKSYPEGFYSRVLYARNFANLFDNKKAIEILDAALSNNSHLIALTKGDALCENLLNVVADHGVDSFILPLKEYIRGSADPEGKIEEAFHLIKTNSRLMAFFSGPSAVEMVISELFAIVSDVEGLMLYQYLVRFLIQIPEAYLERIFSGLIDVARDDNFILIHGFLNILFECYGKESILDKFEKVFNEKISSVKIDIVILFLGVGVSINLKKDEAHWRLESKLFDALAKKENYDVIFAILDNPHTKNTFKDGLFRRVILHSKNYDIESMMRHYPIRINNWLLEDVLFRSGIDTLSYFFKLILEMSGYKLKFREFFLQVWAFRSRCPSAFIDGFIQQCGATYIRYLSVMCMLDYMESATMNNWSVLKERFSNIFERDIRISPHDSAVLENRPGSIAPHYDIIDYKKYLTVLRVLNDYFSKRDILPLEEETKQVFNALLREFEKRVKRSRFFTFFPASTKSDEFDRKMYDFLHSTDERVSAFEPKVVEVESDSPKTMEPESLDYIVCSPLMPIVGRY